MTLQPPGGTAVAPVARHDAPVAAQPVSAGARVATIEQGQALLEARGVKWQRLDRDDTGGWVLVWLGLWFPLDTMLFTPLAYGRENRVLERLRRANIALEPHRRAA